MKAGRDYVGVGVGAIVFNEQGEVFLAQRGSQAKNERGCWEFPGGSVDFGERLEDAIQREFLEEYDMTIAIERLLHVVDHLLPEEGQHWVSPTYLAHHVSGTPCVVEPDKCSAIGWFALGSLPTPLSRATIEDMRVYGERRSGISVVGLDHVQLAMPAGEEETARAFYADLLGLSEIPKPAQLVARGGCWFAGLGLQIHLGVEEEFRPARKAHPALLITDLERLRATLAAADVQTISDDTVPGVRRFYAPDPFGNRLEFIQDGDGFNQQARKAADAGDDND